MIIYFLSLSNVGITKSDYGLKLPHRMFETEFHNVGDYSTP